MVVGLIHCYFTYTECGECGDDNMPPFCGFDVGYRRLNRYILTIYVFFWKQWWLGHHQMVS